MRDRPRYPEKFEKLSREMKISQIWESVEFLRKDFLTQYIRTVHDVNDDLGRKTESCREYTLPRDVQDSESIGRIYGHEDRVSPSSQRHMLS